MKVFQLILFLVINFGGLYIGNLLMNNGPTSQWYFNLNQAPWTPPGWVFGVAWTAIMICFSIYLAYLFKWQNSSFLWLLYGLQVLLNVSWNYLFFNQHLTFIGLIVIVLLLIVILYYFLTFKTDVMQNIRYLLLPYIIWLCIAVSLNLYIVIRN
ncbi:TspO/MBR family protein [Pontimicrobium sp. SW4]|uniref:TspO/MBR family protein n=1 Tax=Pontimicrobium sp. SW4 TaxID=3153519 RepID=A0AAU7BW61_9FLAO